MQQQQISLVGIDHNIAYSQNTVWAYYRLGTHNFDFEDHSTKISLAQNIDTGLASLVTKNQPVEFMLHPTQMPFNVNKWEQDYNQTTQKWGTLPTYTHHMNITTDYLTQAQYHQKTVYLAIKLGDRQNATNIAPLTHTIKQALNLIEKPMQIQDHQISEKEIQAWRDKETETARILSADPLRATKTSGTEIALLLKKSLHPSTPTPTPHDDYQQDWGTGEIYSLAESHITNHKKWLTITQTQPDGTETTGYRTTLSIAKFPPTLTYPNPSPWMHYLSALGDDHEIYTRGELVPPEKVKKEIETKTKNVIDEMRNASQSDLASLPTDIRERYQAANKLQEDLSSSYSSQHPIFQGAHRIIVTAPTKTELKDKIQQVIQHYKSMDITVTWSTGDQLKLLLESQPADKLRLKAYIQRQSINIISGGMPTANSAVGDKIINQKGFISNFIGYTNQSLIEPVFFSPHATIASGAGSGGLLITGSPGKGKTYLSFYMMTLMTLSGVETIFIDPKGDSLPCQYLPEIREHTTVWDLQDGEAGIFDPFVLGKTEPEKLLLALQTIASLIGEDQMSKHRPVIVKTIEEIMKHPNPSLQKITDYLEQLPDPGANDVGTILRLTSKLKFSNLCFAPHENTDTASQTGNKKLTIITLTGMKIPHMSIKKEDYTLEQRLSVTIMYLLTRYARELMFSRPKHLPKAIMVDEAWAILGSNAGVELISETARLGRSLNTALITISQNSEDYEKHGIMNSMPNIISFGAEGEDVPSVLKSLGIRENQDAYTNLITQLPPGEALFKDAHNRLSRFRIFNPNEIWNYFFDTNPQTKQPTAQLIELSDNYIKHFNLPYTQPLT